ncbi:phage/plasmid primase, P4 family [Gottfriedia acidiceleris]|uniref:phage/plasmid primase, P4 family n=1 Tax=Gottfriedia acidiceleris TaxID=371036 RepID=UPI00300028E5
MTYIEFKPREKHASKGADTSPMHESFQDCGYLLEDNDVIIDIDNLPNETIDAMIRTFNITTQIVRTSRGVHLYYKAPRGFKVKKNTVCPLGFEVEYLTKKTYPNGVTIKRDGVLRVIDNAGKREPLPEFFKPLSKMESMLGLGEGDGRNNKLHSHKFKLMQLDNYKKILRFINDHVFAESMEDKEFEEVTRDEQIRAEKDNEHEIAMQLIKKLKIVEFANQFYYYDGDKYQASELKREVAKHLRGQKSYYIDEVVKQIDLYPNKVEQPDRGFDIRFKNGILRHKKGFIEVLSEEFTPYYIDIEYKDDADKVADVDNYLDQLTGNDEDYKKLLLEMIAHTLITNMEFKKKLARFSVIIGKGGEGKGTLLEIISRILGKENCSYNSIKRLPDERYNYNIEGKLANLGDDIEDKPIIGDEMKMLKNISTCDPVMIRHLNKMARSTRLTASLIFTSNHMLKTHEKDNSYKRRVVWCPMFNQVVKSDGDIISKLTTSQALEYWLKLIVDAYHRLYDQGGFTNSEKVNKFTESYHEENNTCLEWVRDQDIDLIIGKRPPQIYEEYKLWAEENIGEGKAQSSKLLRATIESEYELIVTPRKVNGKSAKVYVKVG